MKFVMNKYKMGTLESNKDLYLDNNNSNKDLSQDSNK